MDRIPNYNFKQVAYSVELTFSRVRGTFTIRNQSFKRSEVREKTFKVPDSFDTKQLSWGNNCPVYIRKETGKDVNYITTGEIQPSSSLDYKLEDLALTAIKELHQIELASYAK